MAEDRMLSDEILLGIINGKSGGGGGGTSNYNDLSNKPQIGGTTLTGNKSASDLGLVAAETGKGLSTNDFTDAYKTAIGDNTTAISGIKNGDEINSFGGVEIALALKQNATDNSLETTDKTIVGAINEHEGDVSTLKSGFTNLDNEVNGDATVYPYADVITIEDAVPSNLADCNVKIEPVQDLHGQSAPYVGGAGKNKAPMVLADIKTANTTGTWSGNEYTINSGKVTVLVDSDNNITGFNINGTFSTVTHFYLFNGTFPAGSYKITGGVSDALAFGLKDNSDTTVWATGVEKSYELSEDKANCNMRIIIGADTFDNVKVYPMIRLATETDATFAPYTNICPITGHTEASVQRDGKNFCPYGSMKILNGEYFTLPAGTYTFSLKVLGSYKYTTSHIGLYDDPDEPALCTVRGATGAVVNTQLTLAKSTQLYVRIVNMDADSNGYYCDNIQIELGQTATPYEPYAGKTYTIALGDTIYGGTVDFDSGVMKVTHAIVDMGTLTWGTPSTGNKFFRATPTGMDTSYDPTISNGHFMCSHYSYAAVGITNWDNGICLADQYVRVRDDAYAEATEVEFKTAMDGVQLVYPLATPTTIQLTPQQIQLLKGQNTLTASTGQISVTANGVSGAIGQVQEQVNGLEQEVNSIENNIADLKFVRLGSVANSSGITINYAVNNPSFLIIGKSEVNGTAKQMAIVLTVINGVIEYGRTYILTDLCGNYSPEVTQTSGHIEFPIGTYGSVFIISGSNFTAEYLTT